tara:strand:+ start:135 stop:503 length:369 start_codon:yes stop_codon:yes gene_type:complete
MKYVVLTQSLENYGAHCEDGAYPNNNRWKFKAGTDYIVTGLDHEADAVAYVQALCAKHGNSLGYKEFPTSWMTHDEWMTNTVHETLDEEHRQFILSIAKRVDPRGQDVIDLLDRPKTEATTL